MGGCRCSYKDCTRTSNGTTHFFHYPWRDLNRCIVWMTNANRGEFNELTPAQLKNRVICQYHFKDEMFMNYNHDRLVQKAVPIKFTEISSDEVSNNNNLEKSEVTKDDTLNKNNESVGKGIENVSKNIDNGHNNIDNGHNNIDNVDKSFDVEPSNKADSTMEVNECPIIGLSFTVPPNKPAKKISNNSLSAEQQNMIICKIPVKPTPVELKQRTVKHFISNSGTQSEKLIECKNIPGNAQLVDPLAIDDGTIILNSNISREILNSNFQTQTTNVNSQKHVHNSPGDVSNTVTSSNSSVWYVPSNVNTPLKLIPNILKASKQNLNRTKEVQGLLNCAVQQRIICKDRVLKKELDNKNNNSLCGGVLAVTPVSSKISVDTIGNTIIRNSNSKPEEALKKNNSQTEEMLNEYVKLVNENSKQIAELKRLVLAQKTDKRTEIKHRFRKVKRKPQKFSKAVLYAHIVPYLSPKLAKLVHMEMFPTLTKNQ